MFYIIGLTDQKSCASQRHSFFRCLQLRPSIASAVSPLICVSAIASPNLARRGKHSAFLYCFFTSSDTGHATDRTSGS